MGHSLCRVPELRPLLRHSWSGPGVIPCQLPVLWFAKKWLDNFRKKHKSQHWNTLWFKGTWFVCMFRVTWRPRCFAEIRRSHFPHLKIAMCECIWEGLGGAAATAPNTLLTDWPQGMLDTRISFNYDKCVRHSLSPMLGLRIGLWAHENSCFHAHSVRCPVTFLMVHGIRLHPGAREDDVRKLWTVRRGFQSRMRIRVCDTWCTGGPQTLALQFPVWILGY